MKRVVRWILATVTAVAATVWMGLMPTGSAQDAVVEIKEGAVQIRGAVVKVKGAAVEIKIEAKAKGPAKEAAKEAAGEKPKREFPPELEKALKVFKGMCVEARRKPAQKEIEESIEKLAEFHKLEKEAVEKLKANSKKAVESSLKPWGDSVEKYLREAFEEELGEEKLAEAMKELFEELKDADPDDIIGEIPAGGNSRPDEQPEWQAVLTEVLTAEQLAAWEKRKADEKAKLEQQFAKLIEISSDNYKRQYGAKMDPLVDDIISTTKLDEVRSGKLKEAAEAAIDQFTIQWKKKAAEYVEEVDEKQRENMLKRGYISVGVETDSLPAKQKKWTDALDIILTQPEKKQWEQAVADRNARRERTAKRMTITAVDELMALTAEQREKLEPLLEEKATASLATQLTREYWGSMSVPRIVQYAKVADQKKIEAILDDTQWKRWQAVVTPARPAQKAKPKEKEKVPKPPPGPNPVAMESAITAHLYRTMLTEREKILSNVLVQAEDAGRVVSLSPEARANLQTAAKGAAEEEIQTWATNMNNWVRRSVKGANPGNIEQKLKNLGSVRFGRSEKAHQSQIWKSAVSTHLNENQQEAWQVEIDAREAYRRESLASLMITQLDNAARLTNQQVGQVEPLLATAIEEYGPDIDRYFSSWSNNTPWYLNSYYSMIPFQGIPETESKKILTKAQWKVWEERFQNRVSHYWDQVLEYHGQRTKLEEKEKEKKTAQEDSEEPEESVKES